MRSTCWCQESGVGFWKLIGMAVSLSGVSDEKIWVRFSWGKVGRRLNLIPIRKGSLGRSDWLAEGPFRRVSTSEWAVNGHSAVEIISHARTVEQSRDVSGRAGSPPPARRSGFRDRGGATRGGSPLIYLFCSGDFEKISNVMRP